jgi:multidrug efflux system membrane fusion protein
LGTRTGFKDAKLQKRAEGRPARAGARNWLWLLAAAVAIGGYWGWALYELGKLPVLQRPAVASRAQSAPAPQRAPVHIAVVAKKDYPVFINGLGTVQAMNAITVRSRVDGQIQKIAFQEGELVHEGDLLVQIDPAPYKAAYDQAVAKLSQDEANLGIAKPELTRTQTLAKQGWATIELRDQREASVAQLTAQIEADKAAIQSAKVQLDYTTIKAPLSGEAGFRLIDVGNIVQANDPRGVLTITQIEPISVIFTAPENQLQDIQQQLKSGPLKVQAYSSDGQKLLSEGQLMLVDNQVDTASGTIRLKARFNNKDHRLWPGLSVSTRLLLKTLKGVVTVPDIAVQRGPNGLYAFVLTDGDKAELRPLEVGPIANGFAVIEKGLEPGERIVTSGQYKVQPGGPVEILTDGEPQVAGERGRTEVD